MASANVRNAREIVEFYNRKFKIELTSFLGSDGKATWTLPPLNEMGFSQNYSQCVIQISRFMIENNTGSINHCNDLFCKVGENVITDVGGLNVELDIPTRNRATSSNEYAQDQGFPASAQNLLVKNGVFGELIQLTPHALPLYDTTAIDGQVPAGTVEINVLNDDATSFVKRRQGYHYNTTRSVEDGGILCANPFGTRVTLSLRSAQSNAPVELASGTDITTDDGKKGVVTVVLEILMLENPSPTNR
tara:strand:- start:1381 stop:2121 length:741 start_codon:yes stop_codon:yes gene_type:complete